MYVLGENCILYYVYSNRYLIYKTFGEFLETVYFFLSDI